MPEWYYNGTPVIISGGFGHLAIHSDEYFTYHRRGGGGGRVALSSRFIIDTHPFILLMHNKLTVKSTYGLRLMRPLQFLPSGYCAP